MCLLVHLLVMIRSDIFMFYFHDRNEEISACTRNPNRQDECHELEQPILHR